MKGMEVEETTMSEQRPHDNDRGDLGEPDVHEDLKGIEISGPAGGFDMASVRLSQDFQSKVGSQKATLTVPVKKPDKHWWFYIHPEEPWRLQAALIEFRDDNQVFLVHMDLLGELVGEWAPKLLVAAQTRQGTIFLWPIKLPDEEGRLDSWNQSALDIVEEYAGRWIRVTSNRQLGAYEPTKSTVDIQPPTWPGEGFEKLVERAFKGKIIDTPDHPVIQRLRGKV